MNMIEEYMSIHCSEEKETKWVVLTDRNPINIQFNSDSHSLRVPAEMIYGELAYESKDSVRMLMRFTIKTTDSLLEEFFWIGSSEPIEVIGQLLHRNCEWNAEGIIKHFHANNEDGHYFLEMSINTFTTTRISNIPDEAWYSYFF
ncbi:hypothetical protein O0R52_21725 (plasmid) [Bacillus halotolerans]|uniref:DUF4265 domain-containing protein n=1 Tax=Bacillus halotolerans TaxID=260554 RepID=A0ABY7I6J8_9BACI|nr:hypothetical protein [Bacillus halotolerans]WAT23619.1 hypothetical protein O0R52_21725 [Bacillus halotolerans]